MKTQKLSELAKTIRSKNAGVDLITFDIIFRERATYERVKRSRVLGRRITNSSPPSRDTTASSSLARCMLTTSVERTI